MAFAIANRRLPCPADDTIIGNGDEQFVDDLAKGVGKCANFNNGFVPARTLGLGERGPNGVMQDGWGFGIRYAVTQVAYIGDGKLPVPVKCSPPSTSCFPFTQTDGIKNAGYLNDAQPPVASLLQVCASSTGIIAPTATTLGNCGTVSANRVVQPAFIVWSTARNGGQLPDGSGADEKVNLSGISVYVIHSRTEPGATNGAFDDILQWQTVAAVFDNMIKIGILP